MARILMCWELGSGLAYIEGLTLAAKTFKKAGHEVLFAVRDLGHAGRLAHFSMEAAMQGALESIETLAKPRG